MIPDPSAVPAPPRPVARVCVFCGAQAGNRPDYTQAAQTLGILLARQGLGLVYGGASVGLMGTLADAALAGGTEVVGVLPSSLVQKELAHPRLSELHVVDSLADRKQLMFDRADAFLTLPGGVGTLDELGEVLAWARLGLHDKPIGVLNVSGYFDGFLAWLERAVTDGLTQRRHLAPLFVEREPAELVQALLNRLPSAVTGTAL